MVGRLAAGWRAIWFAGSSTGPDGQADPGKNKSVLMFMMTTVMILMMAVMTGHYSFLSPQCCYCMHMT